MDGTPGAAGGRVVKTLHFIACYLAFGTMWAATTWLFLNIPTGEEWYHDDNEN